MGDKLCEVISMMYTSYIMKHQNDGHFLKSTSPMHSQYTIQFLFSIEPALSKSGIAISAISHVFNVRIAMDKKRGCLDKRNKSLWILDSNLLFELCRVKTVIRTISAHFAQYIETALSVRNVSVSHRRHR